ncbi:MAG: HAD-IIA family hydrolase [Chloroflexota bacterium]
MYFNELSELRTLKGLVIDMDGVLWQGNTPMPGLHEFFNVLQERQIKFILATNNNTQTPQGFVEKARSMGVEVLPDQVVNAAVATVHYLCSKYPPGSRIYVVGEAALKGLISDAGFELADIDVHVVVGTMDRQLTYDMLKRATLLIRTGADFIAPNNDPSYPTAEGIVPGGGAIVAAIAVASDCQPLIIGKPESWMFRISLERMQLGVEETASLGDRLSTDIFGGHRLGLKTILTLGGVSTLADVEASPVKPSWIFSGIDELTQALRSS